MKLGLIYSVTRILAMLLLKPLFRYEIKGKNNIPKHGKYIVCSNHISNADIIFLGISQRRQIFFMTKEELFKNRLLGRFFTALGWIPVNRGKSDVKALLAAKDLLNEDKVLGVFIEGTRAKDGKFIDPKPGVAFLSYKANAPVIPVCITCKSGGRLRVFKKVIISFDDPIVPKELGLVKGVSSEYRRASDLIMDRIKQLRYRDLEEK